MARQDIVYAERAAATFQLDLRRTDPEPGACLHDNGTGVA
jgi:hypothetical protein